MIKGPVQHLYPLLSPEGFPADDSEPPHRFRTIWISDVHLGTRGCKAELLLDFLRHHSADNLYLVGDIVDGWRLRRLVVAAEPQRRGAEGPAQWRARAPGHLHPGQSRRVCCATTLELHFGGVWLLAGDPRHRRRAPAAGAARRRVRRRGALCPLARLPGRLGLHAVLQLNHCFNILRRRFGYPYWSLSAYLKSRSRTPSHSSAISRRHRPTRPASAASTGWSAATSTGRNARHRRHALCNDGDWVESCTALVEHVDGRLEILPLGRAAGARSPRVAPASSASW